MAFTTKKLSLVGRASFPGMPFKERSVVAPPFPLLDLSKARTVADVLAAVGVVTDKIKEKRVKEPSVPSVPSAPSPKRKGGKK